MVVNLRGGENTVQWPRALASGPMWPGACSSHMHNCRIVSFVLECLVCMLRVCLWSNVHFCMLTTSIFACTSASLSLAGCCLPGGLPSIGPDLGLPERDQGTKQSDKAGLLWPTLRESSFIN